MAGSTATPGPTAFPSLFSPIRVGTMALDHRLVVPPHGGSAGTLLGPEAEFEQYCRHWLAKVEGGVQWVGGRPNYVRNPLPPGFEPTGIGAHGPGLFRHPEFVPRLTQFVDRIHAAGGFVSSQFVLQGGMPLAPSPTLSGYYDHRVPHPMNLQEIAWLVTEYGESAARAAAAGIDALELHANHDDVLQWFLSPLTNHRTDGYGGGFEGRRRLLREVVASMRERVLRPITIGLRLCLDEMIEGGYGIDDCRALVAAFTADGNVDYFSFDVGSNWGDPSYVPMHTFAEGAWAPLCALAKAETDLPVVYAGRVTTPERAEEILAAGQADLVAVARGIMADPTFVARVKDGEARRIRPCIGLNECIHRGTVEGLPFACGVNPQAGREREGALPPPRRPRSVLVIGGGPGGTETAALCAEQGHRVALWEREQHLGGQLAVAARARMNRTYQRWIDWQADRLGRVGVDVVLGREASAADVLAAGADTVVVATGAVPRPLAVPGSDLAHVVQASAVLTGAATPGRRVLVVCEDDRLAPLAVADQLAADGREVTVVYRTAAPAPLVGKYSLGTVLGTLDRGGVRLEPLARVVAIEPEQVHLAHPYSGRRWCEGPFDTVVLACGAVPDDALYLALQGAHPDVHLLGDAYAPRRMVFATRQAWDLARTLA